MSLQRTTEASREIPDIVPIVLSELHRRYHRQELDEATFRRKIDRLAAEELAPRNLSLLVRNLSDGGTRFLIKTLDTQQVCSLFEYGNGNRKSPAL